MFKELLKDAWPLIEKGAPILAGALGSPVAGIGASLAINMLGSAFGVNPNNIDELKNAIINHPLSNDLLADVENGFSVFFKNRLPLKAEINVKLEWEPIS